MRAALTPDFRLNRAPESDGERAACMEDVFEVYSIPRPYK